MDDSNLSTEGALASALTQRVSQHAAVFLQSEYVNNQQLTVWFKEVGYSNPGKEVTAWECLYVETGETVVELPVDRFAAVPNLTNLIANLRTQPVEFSLSDSASIGDIGFTGKWVLQRRMDALVDVSRIIQLMGQLDVTVYRRLS